MNHNWWWNPVTTEALFLVQDTPYNVIRDINLGIIEYDYPAFTPVETPVGGEGGIVFLKDDTTIGYILDELYGTIDMLVSPSNRFCVTGLEDEDYSRLLSFGEQNPFLYKTCDRGSQRSGYRRRP